MRIPFGGIENLAVTALLVGALCLSSCTDHISPEDISMQVPGTYFYTMDLCRCDDSQCNSGALVQVTYLRRGGFGSPEIQSVQPLGQGCKGSDDVSVESLSDAVNKGFTEYLLVPEGTVEQQTGTPVVGVPPVVLPLPFQPLGPVPFVVPPCNAAAITSLFHVDHVGGMVRRVNTCPLSVAATIPVTSRPLQVAVTPNGSLAIVTSYDGAVTFIDSNTDKVAATIQTDSGVHPSGIAISSDGTTAYVTNFFPVNPEVLVIDIASRSIRNTIPTAAFPHSIFLTPDGSLAFVTFYAQNYVSVIDTLTGTVTGSIAVSNEAEAVAFTADGTTAYIASLGSPGSVQVIDMASLQSRVSIPVGNSPEDAALTPDGQFLFVVNYGSGSISIINTSTNSVAATTPIPGAAALRGLTFLP